jgi:hypothetical protein
MSSKLPDDASSSWDSVTVVALVGLKPAGAITSIMDRHLGHAKRWPIKASLVTFNRAVQLLQMIT